MTTKLSTNLIVIFGRLLRGSQLILMLDRGDGALQRTGQIDMEEGAIQAMHDSHPLRRRSVVRLAIGDLPRQIRAIVTITATRVGAGVVFVVMFFNCIGPVDPVATTRARVRVTDLFVCVDA